ncbi:DUF3048 domain-containing protein [Alteribacter natronophilus]|uniref:DUF3048 domain-containing protein n=1 Tax=Alteribacter natronophilus TaxID=2583810 RepID=UPI00110EC115|nr:DUF3048 domain-containing protein [Alteribacter natronophilus]TMW71110.1 DUF3048 domain-containing protein [Alteribacter natronophilus]
MKWRKQLLTAVLCAGVVALAACSGNEASGEEEADDAVNTEGAGQAEETDTSHEGAEEEAFAFKAPLTGKGTDEELSHTAFGVMVENSANARPQTGLYQADLVYEVLSEGNITRFLAVYHSQKPEMIGPVRSAREYYVHLNNGYSAIYAAAGGSPGGLALAEGPDTPFISGLAYDGRYFTRSSERRAPHNMYTGYENLKEASLQIGHDLEDEPPALTFDETPAEGKAAVGMEINYGSAGNNVRYEYDADLGAYKRSNGGSAILDHRDGTPVAPVNVLAVVMDHQVIDDQGRREINLSSGGKAYLFREGVVEELEWQNVDGRILPFKSGEPAGFLPGQTWINVIPSEDRLTIQD